MHQKPFGGRALPGPAGELTVLPRLLSYIKVIGPREGEGRKGRGIEKRGRTKRGGDGKGRTGGKKVGQGEEVNGERGKKEKSRGAGERK